MFDNFRKTTNLLGVCNIVVADLGFAKQLDEDGLAKTQCGTPLYMAPEILNGKLYNSKADVWSLGAVFFEMLTGFQPFTGMNKEDLKRNIERGNYMFPKNIHLSLEGLDFMNCCLQHNPDERMSWDDLMRHSYLQYDWAKQQQINQSDLMLSYCEDSGIYSAEAMHNPHAKLNQQNAITINTKDPRFYQQTYEKTIMKQYQDQIKDHAQEQINNIEKINQELGESALLKNWDLEDQIQDPIPVDVQEPYQFNKNDLQEPDEKSSPFLVDMIQKVEIREKKPK